MIAILFVLAIGLAFGSFITCMSWRLPRGEAVVRRRSYCPVCDSTLGFRDLWPVISWLTSGGQCRHCHTKISARYPLIECVTAAVFLLIYNAYGITPQAFILAAMAAVLMLMIVVDLEHYIIPDEVHALLLPLGLLWHFVIDTPWPQVLYGFLLGLGLGLLLHFGYRAIRKKEGLGFGDVKFLAVAGIWLTIASFPPFLLLAGLLGVGTGLVWRALGKGRIFPFGPALALSLFLSVAFLPYVNIFNYIDNYLK